MTHNERASESVTLTRWREPDTGTTCYKLAIGDDAIDVAKLDSTARRILNVCSRSDASIADVLLGLETLVRQIAASVQSDGTGGARP